MNDDFIKAIRERMLEKDFNLEQILCVVCCNSKCIDISSDTNIDREDKERCEYCNDKGSLWREK